MDITKCLLSGRCFLFCWERNNQSALLNINPSRVKGEGCFCNFQSDEGVLVILQTCRGILVNFPFVNGYNCFFKTK